MSSQQSTAIIIPARLASKRLPNKPLLEINSKTMIEHVWENAINSQLGTVIVATDSQEIIDVIQRRNGIACMTSENHQSGTDRIYEALNFFDQNQAIEKVINLQGDLPTIDQLSQLTIDEEKTTFLKLNASDPEQNTISYNAFSQISEIDTEIKSDTLVMTPKENYTGEG